MSISRNDAQSEKSDKKHKWHKYKLAKSRADSCKRTKKEEKMCDLGI